MIDEDNCDYEREFYDVRNDLNQSSVSKPSKLNRKRKVFETDMLVDDSNFEEFERSLLSKLWKDVDGQNKVVWKVSILAIKLFSPSLCFPPVKGISCKFSYGFTMVENASFSVSIVIRHRTGRIQ